MGGGVSLSLWQEWERPFCLLPQHTPRVGAALPPLFTESWLMASKGRCWPVGCWSGLCWRGRCPRTFHLHRMLPSAERRALHGPTSHSETGSHSPLFSHVRLPEPLGTGPGKGGFCVPLLELLGRTLHTMKYHS